MSTWMRLHSMCGKAVDLKEPNIVIDTLEGQMMAVVGDYIIKGVQGEFYPCKPDIFEPTYKAMEGLE